MYPRTLIVRGYAYFLTAKYLVKRVILWYYSSRILMKRSEIMKNTLQRNSTPGAILSDALLAFVSLFFNGLGVYLTIHADIGAGPWDVFNLGLSNTFGIRYGNASITVSLIILLIDILMREPIGIAMFIDAVTVGKAVDLFDRLELIPVPSSLPGSIFMMLCGLTIMGYTQYFYMAAALGCGPRDTLLVAMAKRVKNLPIGLISVVLLSLVTLTGYLLGGPVGIGTLICAFCSGPIMQAAFKTVHFDATGIRHQRLFESFNVLKSHIIKNK